VDTRDTPEQAELRRAARQLAGQLGPAMVVDLDDAPRGERLAAAVREAGWLELRDDGGDATPLAGGVEVGIVAEALGAAVADAAFAGPVLARDLLRRAGVTDAAPTVVAFAPSLLDAEVVGGTVTTVPAYAIDGGNSLDTALVLVSEAGGYRLAHAPVERASGGSGTDLTRAVHVVAAGSAVEAVAGQRRLLTRDDLAEWSALGLALTSADLVGVMRGVLAVTVAYAAERRQYGVPVGSFQAVQHLLAEAHCLMEGSLSAALHASWSVDNRPPADALEAGRVAKAYCSRAARTACETAVQVHGGIGNTWECMVHVYLRRALLSAQWFGDDAVQLRELQGTRLGAVDGLS
jgi:Acyl-CoA dehydrogenase, C-terminal domain